MVPSSHCSRQIFQNPRGLRMDGLLIEHFIQLNILQIVGNGKWDNQEMK